MARSMTGYGQATFEAETLSVDVEVRSYNNRYFKYSSRLPPALSSRDVEIERILRERVGRGSVDLTVRLLLKGRKAAFGVDHDLVRSFLDACLTLKDDYSLHGDLTVDLLPQIPGAFLEPVPQPATEEEWNQIRPAIEAAAEKLNAMRETEGAVLTKDISARAKLISGLVRKIEARAGRIVKEYQKKLKARVRELLRGTEAKLNDSDLLREIALFADRADISEELTRLKSHLVQYQDVLASEKEVGRRLEFLIQEMLREVNTLGNKANDLPAIQATIAIKAEIEKIKEQLQNLE